LQFIYMLAMVRRGEVPVNRKWRH